MSSSFNAKESSPCCGGGASCGPSRYPVPPQDLKTVTQPEGWKRSAGVDQFSSYGKSDAVPPGPYDPSAPFTYQGQYLAACNFPLGGFGCGQVLFQGDGTLTGWTVLNQGHNSEYGPLHKIPGCNFSVWADDGKSTPQAYLLATPANYSERNQQLPFDHDACVSADQVHRLRTFPGIKSLTIEGKYPIADVSYDIPGLPVNLSLEAVTPLIPDDTKASGLPVAVFTFTATNPGSTSVNVRLMEAQTNFVGWNGSEDCTKSTPFWGGNVNTPFVAGADGLTGVLMTSNQVPSGTNPDGNVAVSAVAGAGLTAGIISGVASEEELWAHFTSGKIPTAGTAAPTLPSAAGTSWQAGVVQSFTVPAGGSVKCQFILSWYFPHRTQQVSGFQHMAGLPDVIGNAYQNWFPDAVGAAQYMQSNSKELLSVTRVYTDSIFGSTIPPVLLDSAAGRVACMRSPTMWIAKDGTVMGCEGNRCCPLNCSHVYGYTTLLERLFPSLAKSMEESNFIRNFTPGKGVNMRFSGGGWALDGSLASVLKTYLTVRQSDPTGAWLAKVWPNVKAMMELVLTTMDTEHDGVIRGPQQNTYDSTMVGANTFHGSYYVAALKATDAMATLMGDPEFAKVCADRANLSAANYEKICWNEKFGYYIADVTAKNCQNSYGPGCFVDQLCAIGLSSSCGLGYNFNPAHEARARESIQKYNTVKKPPFQDLQKHFYDGDVGVTVCEYPNGKLANGMKYTNLVSAGFTSPVIAGMLLDRNLSGAETVAGNIRNRHDGRNRSPWNEPECNILYSRSMAHWNIFDQAAGHCYDATKGSLSFDPRYAKSGSFKCFFHVNGGWGNYEQDGNPGLPSGKASLTLLRGTATITSLGLASSATTATAKVGGTTIAVTLKEASAGIVLEFSPKLTLVPGAPLVVTLGTSFSAVTVENLGPRFRGKAVASRSGSVECCGGQACGPTPAAGKAAVAETVAWPMKTKILVLLVFLLVFVAGALLGTFVASQSHHSATI